MCNMSGRSIRNVPNFWDPETRNIKYTKSQIGQQGISIRYKDVFITAHISSSHDKLMANILSYLSTNIHYLFIIKNSMRERERHYSEAPGKVAHLNK